MFTDLVLWPLLLLLAADPWACIQTAPDPWVVTVQAKAIVRTAEEKAQDNTYLQQHHWRLSAGSCGMLGCTIHGGGRELVPGPSPAATPSPPTNTSCPGGNCRPRWRLFRR